MNYIKYLLPLLFAFSLLSCEDDDTNSYNPSFEAASDIKNEIDDFKKAFSNYSSYIDTITHEKKLEYGFNQYKSFIDILPDLKNEVEAKADDINWPQNYPEDLAQEERMIANEYLTVIDSLTAATKLYYSSVKEIIDNDGEELLFLFNDCKIFMDNIDFSTTSYADISKKYTLLKRSSLVKQLAYFQNHSRKAEVDFFLDNAQNIELVWDFKDITLGNYINRTNFSQLVNDSNLIKIALSKVNNIEDSKALYDSLFLAQSYNPIEQNYTTYGSLHDFATSLPAIITANNYINFVYDYIPLLESDIDSVRNSINTIISRLPATTTQEEYMSDYSTFYPSKTLALQTAFEFPVIISDLLKWGDDYRGLINKTEPLYQTYLNQDTITNEEDIATVNEIDQQNNELTDTYITNQYYEYYSVSYADITDVYNMEATGGKITYLKNLLE